MNLDVALVCGRYPRWNADMRQWGPSSVWKVVLADRKTIIGIPAFAILNEIYAGDTDVVIELKDCSWTRDLEQTLWKQEMEREKW